MRDFCLETVKGSQFVNWQTAKLGTLDIGELQLRMQSAFLYTARRLSHQTKADHGAILFGSQLKILQPVALRDYSATAAKAPDLRLKGTTP